MNFTPQVATAEMSDAELDNISGGLAGGASGALALEVTQGGVGTEVCAFLSAEGGAVAADAFVQAGAH